MKESTKEACCSEDKSERKAQIRKALYGAYFENDADRDYAIDSYTRSTLSIPEIETLVAPLKEIKEGVAKTKAKIFGINNKAGYGLGGIQ